jgi:hypothetical protein
MMNGLVTKGYRSVGATFRSQGIGGSGDELVLEMT